MGNPRNGASQRECAPRIVAVVFLVLALPEKPDPTLAGSKTILDETAMRKAKGMKPEDFVDSSLAKRGDDEGLAERPYKR